MNKNRIKIVKNFTKITKYELFYNVVLIEMETVNYIWSKCRTICWYHRLL